MCAVVGEHSKLIDLQITNRQNTVISLENVKDKSMTRPGIKLAFPKPEVDNRDGKERCYLPALLSHHLNLDRSAEKLLNLFQMNSHILLML